MHYVIGDVHGCFKELKLLLNKIESKDPDAIIYFVGDWVDRGDQVADVMQWVVDNITTTGKYRSVRGNHDQEAMDWYNAYFLPWTKEEHDPYDSLPETYYDFASVVDDCFNRNPEALKPFFDKVRSEMPYNRAVEITTAGGVTVTYRICHAWHRKDESKLFDTNLYERNYWGYYVDDEIIVHGHTPTVAESYRLRGRWDEDRPGMIGYRHNDINVDGGCCFHKGFPNYPCMLCGICLETLEEIYPYSIEDRLMEGARHQVENFMMAAMKDIPFEEKVQAIYENSLESYMNKRSNSFRQELLERLGLTNE